MKKSDMYMSIDCDPLWHYYDSRNMVSPRIDGNLFYEDFWNRIFTQFSKHQLRATLFVVGKDLEISATKEMVVQAVRNGFEIGNHTYSHSIGFSSLSKEEKKMEIIKCHEMILKTTGIPPHGFRAPGWEIDETTLEILEEIGYLYDSSIFPSSLNSIMRLIYRIREGGRSRKAFGEWKLFLSPTEKYHPNQKKPWRRGSMNLWETPCAVIPFVRIPFFQSLFSYTGETAFYICHAIMRLFSVRINYTCHALDFFDGMLLGNDHRLKKPALYMPIAEKEAFIEKILIAFKTYHNVKPINEAFD